MVSPSEIDVTIAGHAKQAVGVGDGKRRKRREQIIADGRMESPGMWYKIPH